MADKDVAAAKAAAAKSRTATAAAKARPTSANRSAALSAARSAANAATKLSEQIESTAGPINTRIEAENAAKAKAAADAAADFVVGTYTDDNGQVVQVWKSGKTTVLGMSGEFAASQATQQLLQQQLNESRAAAAAEADRRQRERISAFDVMEQGLLSFFTSAEDRDTVARIKDFLRGGLEGDKSSDQIDLELRQQDFFKQRFKGNEGRRAAGLAEYDPATYLRAEEQYADILNSYGLTGLARRDTFASLIGGLVSAEEARSRVVNVYDRIRNADQALRQQLDPLFSAGITQEQLAESLLLGKEGAASLQRKIGQAEIRAEAATRGLTSRLSDVELERMGVTRQQAAAGFERVAQELTPLTRLREIYERPAVTTGIAEQTQTELEQEAFMGLQSQRRKRLIEQEAATFSGSAGTQPTLASRARAGQF